MWVHRCYLSFRFHSGLTNCPDNVLCRKRIQFRTTHFIQLSQQLDFFLSRTVSHPFLLFLDLGTFKDYRPVVFQTGPQFGFVCCFLMVRFRLQIFGRNNRRHDLCLLLSGSTPLRFFYYWWSHRSHQYDCLPAFSTMKLLFFSL